jgi:hypothetical protein
MVAVFVTGGSSMQIRGLFAGMAALAVLALVGCGAKSGGKSPDGEKKTEGSGKADAKPADGDAAKPADGAATAAAAKEYALKGCLMSGKDVDEAATLVHEGQTYKFCCTKCQGKFKADTAAGTKSYTDKVAAK